MHVQDMVVTFENKIRVVQINSTEWSVVGGLLPQHTNYATGLTTYNALEETIHEMRKKQSALQGDIDKLKQCLKEMDSRSSRIQPPG